MESKQPPGRTPAPTEKDALRIQAAALVAQQAALAEHETKLRQEQVALEQHQSELAGHLEEKRRRLLELQERTRKDHSLLQEQRAAHERYVSETTRALELTENDVADGRKQLQLQRRRLLALRQRLKKRWHRQWLAERTAWQHRQEELTRRAQQLELEKDLLRKERTEWDQLRLRQNSEIELAQIGRQADRQEIRKSQDALQQSEADLAEREAKHLAEKRRWEKTLPGLAKEAEALENRTRQQRLKLAELEQTVARQARKASQGSVEATPDSLAAFQPTQSPALGDQVNKENQERFTHLHDWEAGLNQYWAALESLAGDLADQRLHLAEQCERLVLAQKRCQLEQEAARDKQKAEESILRGKELEIEKISAGLQQRNEATAQAQIDLEIFRARLTARMLAWEGDRQRWTAQLVDREELIERLLSIISELYSQWRERYRQECERFRAQQEDLQETQRDLAAQRELWLERCEELERQNGVLVRRFLSLDQDNSIPQEKSKRQVGNKLLMKWGGRLAGFRATLERTSAQERRALQAEAAKLEERFAQLQIQSQKTAERETDLASREIVLEHSRALAESAYARMRQELQTLNDQRDAYERQVAELKAEVERLASLLLKGDDAIPFPVAKAA